MTDGLEALRARFLAQCAEDLRLVAHAIADAETVEAPLFAQRIHRLAGAAGIFGFAVVSDRARVVDDRLTAKAKPLLESLEALAAALAEIARAHGA